MLSIYPEVKCGHRRERRARLSFDVAIHCDRTKTELLGRPRGMGAKRSSPATHSLTSPRFAHRAPAPFPPVDFPPSQEAKARIFQPE